MKSHCIPALTAYSALVLLLTSCADTLTSFPTGLPPWVDVHQLTNFDPGKARCAAVVVIIADERGGGHHTTPTERGDLVRAITSSVEQRLMASGYSLASGRSIPLVLSHAGSALALDAVDVARQVGADLAFVVTVGEIYENASPHPSDPAQSTQYYGINAMGIGVASRMIGWTGAAHGQTHLGLESMQQAAVEVASTIADRFPAKPRTIDATGK
jgi:hypothetical protein